MTTRYSKFTRSIYLIGDLILLNISFLLSYFVIFGHFYPVEDHYISLHFYFNLTWIITAFIINIYDIQRVAGNKDIILNIIRLFFLHILLTTAFIVVREESVYSRNFLFLAYAITSIAVIFWRLGSVFFFRLYRKAGGNYRRIIIIGFGETGRELKRYFDIHPQYGYRFLGFFDDYINGIPDVKGKTEEIKNFVIKNHVDEIYCSLADINNERVDDLIEFCENHLIRFKIIPDFTGIRYKKFKLDFYGDFPIVTFRDIPLDDHLNQFAKRGFDILFSLIILITVGIWLFPIIAILIWMDSPGPIIFRQRRNGKNKNVFWCYKFRSMHINKECDIRQASRNDERITQIGKFLRKTSLDEFPQFINVLRGDMSVVGPRPHPLKLDERFESLDHYRERQMVKPGVTGLAQVKGLRGETPHIQLMEHRVQMDSFYIKKWSFLLDIKIISMTLGSLVKGDKNAF